MIDISSNIKIGSHQFAAVGESLIFISSCNVQKSSLLIVQINNILNFITREDRVGL